MEAHLEIRTMEIAAVTLFVSIMLMFVQEFEHR